MNSNFNGHSGSEPVVSAITSLPGSDTVEFGLPLHVLKKCDRSGKADVYTIAVWKRTAEGAVLQSLCLLQPLETAVAVVSNLLRSISHEDRAENIGSGAPSAVAKPVSRLRFDLKLQAGWAKCIHGVRSFLNRNRQEHGRELW